MESNWTETTGMTNPALETAAEPALDQRIQRILDTQPKVEKALRSYARDLGVSLDHVILGALVLVAQDYDEATGGGMIPRLNI